MYIIRKGIINAVLSKEQIEKVKNKELDPKEIRLEDCVCQGEREGGKQYQYLPFRISYKEVDEKGQDKFVFNEEKNKYEPIYYSSPVIYAYGKELRILLELGVSAPVKVVYKEQTNREQVYRTAMCIQNQKCGRLVKND